MSDPAASKVTASVSGEVVDLARYQIGPLYCFGTVAEADRVLRGQQDAGQLAPNARYALDGSGFKLLGSKTINDGTLPEDAYCDFRLCGIGEVTEETPQSTLKILDYDPSHLDHQDFVFRVAPARTVGIYVVDSGPYVRARRELYDLTCREDRLATSDERKETERIRARTFVPLEEYKGGYEKPFVLIERRLDFDEVELVSGPWPACQYVRQIISRGPRAHALLQQLVNAWETYYTEFSKKAQQAYIWAMNDIVNYFGSDEEVLRMLTAQLAQDGGDQLHKAYYFMRAICKL